MKLVIEFLEILGTIAVLPTFFAHRREVQTEKIYPSLVDILEVNGKRVHALVMGRVWILFLYIVLAEICAIRQLRLPLNLPIPIV